MLFTNFHVCAMQTLPLGKTKRHLCVRCLEHVDIEDKTPSAIKDHIFTCETCRSASIDNFEILQKCKIDKDAKISEAFFIKTEVPQLNKNLFNSGSLYTLKIYQ